MADLGATMATHLEAREKARMSDRLVQALYLACAAGAIALAGALVGPLRAERSALNMDLNPDIFQQVPPDIAMLSTTLGPLRGLWIYTLWIQADQLKEERRFYDALQRAQWICKLQPRFPEVWEFQSWNMAYNISVTRQTDEERWQWVRNGLELITTQGIPLNPRAERLYKQAAWLFFHKMGDVMDDMHWVYKKEWATEMERVLGRPDFGLNAEETVDRFRRIADAVPTVDRLARQDAAVAALIAKLDENGFKPDHELLWAYHDADVRKQAIVIAAEPDKVIGEAENALWELVRTKENRDAAEKLFATVRHRVLLDEYNMDPSWMLHLMETYGPIDWRVVYAGSLYWSTRGAMMCTIEKFTDPSTEMQRDRLILFSLKGMFQTGRILFTPNLDRPGDSFLAQYSDLDYIDAVHEEHVRFGQKHDPDAAKGTGGYFMGTGHVNTLHEAIRSLWVRGDIDARARAKAEYYFNYLREHYRAPGGGAKAEYMLRLDEWAEIDMKSMAERSRTIVELLSGYFEAELLALAMNEPDEAEAYLAKAEKMYAIYQEDKADTATDRLALLPFDVLHQGALARFFVFAHVPITYKSRVYKSRKLSVSMQQAVYDWIAEPVRSQCLAAGYDFDKAFPEPIRMEAWRATHPAPTTQMFIPKAKPVDPDAPKLQYEVVDL